MTDTKKEENGRRWHDSAKVIWGLFGIIGTIVFALGVGLFSRLSAVELRLERVDQSQQDMKADVKEIKEDLRKRP